MPRVVLKTGVGVLTAAVLSILFVFCHDVITQCRYFALRQITVSGAERISEERILRQAGLRADANILSANLWVARKRLLAHPWISEASIRRVLPSGLRISVREHHPLAIIDLERRFLVDETGRIFKELDRDDPQDLPIVGGLSYADLDLDPSPPLPALRTPEAIAATTFEKTTAHSSIYQAAVSLLRLLRRQAAVLPDERVRFIQVDREIGVSIHSMDRKRSIQMGFNDYARKMDVLKSILDFTRDTNTWHLGEIESIDLKNPDRVVVKMFRKKEV